ncbi:MAG: hypothetical protein RIQ81_554 [Pseudomonadota bacterium]|jgi:deoxyribodipyrimidine photo-lyase
MSEIPPAPADDVRREALARLSVFATRDSAAYQRTRNHLNGNVSGLSPWIRHGVLTATEVRDAVVSEIGPKAAEKFVAELGWREYWHRVYESIGDRIWENINAQTTGWPPDGYADKLPAEVETGRTGLACMDSFVKQLTTTGTMHNHARMWFAAWLVHWLRIRWQTGASFFLRHLLDADIASNNLSWQWVAGTFSKKPYIFNRENLERFTNGVFCGDCPVKSCCPFAGTYEKLHQELFPHAATP